MKRLNNKNLMLKLKDQKKKENKIQWIKYYNKKIIKINSKIKQNSIVVIVKVNNTKQSNVINMNNLFLK